MEVRKGYKQTEVGVIPEDWNIEFIKNLALIKTGSRNTQDKVENGIYPFFVRSQTIESINSYSFDEESVLTAGDGVGVGKVIHYVNGKFDCHQRVYKISDFTPNIIGYFFYLYFCNNFYNRVMQMTAKSSVDSVRMEMIANMPIPFPSTISEQKAIAIALSDADSLISSLEKLIEKKRSIKQGAMQELLKPKEGWNVKKLGELAISVASGKSATQSKEGLYPIYGSTGTIGWNKIFEYEGDRILIARVGANAGLVNKVNGKYCVSDNTLMILLNENVSVDFIFYKLINSQLNRLVFGSCQPLITGGQLKNLEIILPVKLEQTRIATILFDMDAEIAGLEDKLSKYKIVKLGMMQELLTGRIRLV